MNLSNDLISQFVKTTNPKPKTNTESTVYGTTVVQDDKIYVKLDGSELLTPVSTTTDVNTDERVMVMVKDHTATIIGNITSPAARVDSVRELGSKIDEFEIIVADKVSTQEFEAELARIDTLVTDTVIIKEKLDANEAEINKLVASNATIEGTLIAYEAEIKKLNAEKLDANAADIKFATIESLEAIEGEFHTLESTYGEFRQLTTTNFEAVNAEIKKLDAEKLSADQLDAKYANIDFTNITEAAVTKLFTESGIIKDLIVSEGKITGELVGVTIKGDLIEGGTVKADKLVVKGSNGLYYKLNVEAGATTTEEISEEDLQNGLHGSTIIAKSITAEKITVNDLVAFGATIGGFNITTKSLYSGAKASADNTTRGIYLDVEGQFAAGDSDNFLKYYKTDDGTYKLEISASSLVFGANKKTVEDVVVDATDSVRVDMNTQAENVLESCTEMIDSSLEHYVDESEYGSFKEEVESKFAVLDDEITMSFDAVKQDVSNLDADISTRFQELNKNISFSQDGIVISDSDGNYEIQLDNVGGVTIRKNGEVLSQIIGDNFYTGNIVIETNERAQFGNFAFIPRSDGSLSFLKVAESDGFRATLTNNVLTLHGTSSTFEENVLTIGGVASQMNETTLILGG